MGEGPPSTKYQSCAHKATSMIDGCIEVWANGRGNALFDMFYRGKFHDIILY